LIVKKLIVQTVLPLHLSCNSLLDHSISVSPMQTAAV
jgi:hypothetical protein